MKNFIKKFGKLAVVIGGQWGDEGKGKLIDILSGHYDLIARATGGANAGHTIYIEDPAEPGKKNKFVFHLVPSGMLNEGKICIIGNGVVMHLQTFFEELDLLEEHGIQTKERIYVSERAHLLFDYHKIIDGLQEEKKGDKKVGTTKRGIGPCYTDKIRRNGIHVHELSNFEVFEKKYRENLAMLQEMYGKFSYDAEAELDYHYKIAQRLRPMMVDSAYTLNTELETGTSVLVEGANGTMLDIDHGTYPFVTSSNSTIGGVVTGTGIGATKISSVIGIMKAYTTRVGDGPFPTEILDKLGEQIREQGGEYGSTTGRPRRCGWFDAVVGKYSAMINGLTTINLTKIDVLSGLENLKIATAYKYKGEYINTFPANLDILENIEVEYIEMPGWKQNLSNVREYKKLPQNARNYIEKIEELIGVKASSIGVGMGREDMIFK